VNATGLGPAARDGAPAATAWPLAVALALAAPAALAAWALLLVVPPLASNHGALVLAAVLAPALGVALAVRAGLRGGWALGLLAGAVVALSDATLPGRAGTALDLVSVIKLGLWTLGGVVAWVRWADMRHALGHAPCAAMAAFGLWCVFGTLWSVTPAYTLAAAVGWLGMWALATALARALGERDGLLALSAALIAAMGISLVLYQFAPAWALTPMENGRFLRLSGLFGSPNNLGRAAALTLLLACLLLPQLPRAKGLLWLALALALGGACLALSDSRNSAGALVIALAVALFTRHRVLACVVLLVGGCMALALWAHEGALQSMLGWVSRSGRVDEVASLTGRTDIWRATWTLIEQSPLIGHGFATTRETIPATFRGAFGWTTTSAHNLWLQTWVTAGGIGLALVLAAQAAWLREAIRRPAPVRDAVVSFVLVVGLVEASALGPSVNLMSFFLLWALALGATTRARA
jgi:O-antigen ligase